MLRDYFRKVQSAVRFHLASFAHDTYRGVRGEVFWVMEDKATGEITRGHFKNIITLDASILIARLMKGTGTSVPHQSEPSFGVFALAVGTGNISWDLQNPSPATNTQRSLYNELARKAVQTTQFIASDGSLSGVPTNVVDFITTFAESEAVGPIAEMGLLGGDVNPNLSITNPVLPSNGEYDPTVNLTGLDTLVNYLTFPVINKPSTATLSWTWRLTF